MLAYFDHIDIYQDVRRLRNVKFLRRDNSRGIFDMLFFARKSWTASFELPLIKELEETLFPQELGLRKWNEEVGAVCTRVKSLPPAVASGLIADAENGPPIDEFSTPCKTIILFKSWINWAGMPVSWRSLLNLASSVSGRVTLREMDYEAPKVNRFAPAFEDLITGLLPYLVFKIAHLWPCLDCNRLWCFGCRQWYRVSGLFRLKRARRISLGILCIIGRCQRIDDPLRWRWRERWFWCAKIN